MDKYSKIYNKISEDEELFRYIKNEDVIILDIENIIKDAMEVYKTDDDIMMSISEHFDFIIDEIIYSKFLEIKKYES